MAKKPSLSENRNVQVARDLLATQEAKPLQTIRRAKELQRDVREQTYWIAALVYGYYRILIDDEAQREAFYGESFWDREYTPNLKRLMAHIFMYVYGAATGTTGKRASEHGRAMSTLLDRNPPVRVEDIPALLKTEGGFSGLLRKDDEDYEHDDDDDRDESRRVPTSGVTTADDVVDDGGSEERHPREPDNQADNVLADGVEFTSDEEAAIRPPKKKDEQQKKVSAGSKVSENPLKAIPRLDIFRQYLLVEADDKQFKALFDLKVGDFVNRVRIKRLPDSKVFTAFAGKSTPLAMFRLEKD